MLYLRRQQEILKLMKPQFSIASLSILGFVLGVAVIPIIVLGALFVIGKALAAHFAM